jgi:hypothetical protein
MSFSMGDWYFGAAAFMAGAEVSWLLKTGSLAWSVVSCRASRSNGGYAQLDPAFYRLIPIDTLKFLTGFLSKP